jgi:hypothetical protein
MYSATNKTITDIVMFVLISRSSKNGGSGMIIAKMIPSTATGTEMSERFNDLKKEFDSPPARSTDTVRGWTAGRFAAAIMTASCS